METMNELAVRLKSLKNAKTELAEATKKNNAEIEAVELELSNLMIEEGNDGFELNGYKFTLQYKDMFSSTVDKRDDLIEALKMHGIDREEIITETVPAQKLNSIMRSIYESNGEELPEEFDGIVSIYTKQGVGVRKVQGKGGKSKAGKEF